MKYLAISNQVKKTTVSSILHPFCTALFVGLTISWGAHVVDECCSYNLFRDFLPFLIPPTIVIFSTPNIILGVLEMITKLNFRRRLVNLILFVLLFATLAFGYYEGVNNVGEVNEVLEIIKMAFVSLAVTIAPVMINFAKEHRSD